MANRRPTSAPVRGRRVSNSSRASDGPVRIFGLHAVAAALANQHRRILSLTLTANAGRRLADDHGVTVPDFEEVLPKKLDHLLGRDTVHQGALLETKPLPERSIEELVAAAEGGGPLVLLDQVTDPHNVGAILRSAAVFGASGLMMTRRHAPPLDTTLAKSASGALELVPVRQIQNLSRSMADLQERGVTLLGLDGAADTTIEDEPFEGPTALVLGAEGKGLRQLTADTCTRLVRISTSDALASLNVSNAAAVSLHIALTRRLAKAGR